MASTTYINPRTGKLILELTPNEARIFEDLMQQASDSGRVFDSNDYELPNTDENWALHELLEAENLGITVEEWRQHEDYQSREEKGHNGILYFCDFALWRHFKDRVADLVPPELGRHRCEDLFRIKIDGKERTLYSMKTPEGVKFGDFDSWAGKEIQVGKKRGIVWGVERFLKGAECSAAGFPIAILFKEDLG